jgi:S-adenosylmethionine synthetase
MMYGLCFNETPVLIPFPLFSSPFALRLTEVRKKGILSYLRPEEKRSYCCYVTNKP